jgi:molybdenum cofactor cytidylyltransferase
MNQVISAITLSAGLSRRMGKENKLLLPLGNTTILEATLSNIIAAQLGETLVVLGHEAAAISHQLSKNGSTLGPLSIKPVFSILTNMNYEKGMTTSIQTGVAAASDESVGYMICLSDMPFITPLEYVFLKNEFINVLKADKQAIVQPVFKGERGNPTIFSSFYKNDILKLDYTEGCKPIVQANKQHVYLVEMPTDSVLRDIDFKAEYEAILNL